MTSIKMTASQLLLCVLLGALGIHGKPPSAIVGGKPAGVNEFPYTVGLKVYGRHTCGGAIIDSTHILTAAHCVDDGSVEELVQHMVVVSGTNDIRKGNENRIKTIKKHKKYSPSNTWENDIAIITLRTAIKFNEQQKAVKLPTKDLQADVKATASGWGDLSYPNGVVPTDLQKLDMTVISVNKQCKSPLTVLHKSQFCAYSKIGSGLCVGDSGGPLVSDGVLIGITSYVYRCARGRPDIFTRVYSYVDWIKEEMKN